MHIPRWLIILTVIGALGGALYFAALFYFQKHSASKKIEYTLAIIKPDAVEAKNSGKIIDRIEQEGFTILTMTKMTLAKELVEKFYGAYKDRIFFRELVEFMSSGPSIIMILEKENAIKAWREIIGRTDPKQAHDNTIRKLYGTHIGKNAVHGSENPEAAKTEIALFFPDFNRK